MREHEILRVSATLHGKDVEKSAAEARRHSLAWAQNRCGGRLPAEAWNFQTFEYFAGGRTSLGVRLQSDAADLWALRTDDPDKEVPGRVWTTEIIIAGYVGQRPRFSARLLVSTPEESLVIEPHTPGLVRQLVDACGLCVGTYDIDPAPWQIDNDEEVERLLETLLSPERSLPVFVLSVPEEAGPERVPLLDADLLAKSVLGLGIVAVIQAEQTWVLTRRLHEMRSVYGGAVRVYWPGFSIDSDPFKHRLVISRHIANENDKARLTHWVQTSAAADSVKRNRLGRHVLAFADVRNASLAARLRELANEGASESEQLTAARAQIGTLEVSIVEERAAQNYFAEEEAKAQERAEAAEAQLRAANYHIQQLRTRLGSAAGEASDEIPEPEEWAGFADWCASNFAGRVALTPAARRAVRNAAFQDIALAGRVVEWLATTYRDGRMNGAEGDFKDVVIESGIRNSPCGSDEFVVDWQGRRYLADWHIKNGGNTRDPARCLRIYYFWEPETEEVVIADMPHHRQSAVS